MKICISVGHSRLKNGNYTSADGTSKGGKNEYLYNKELAPKLVNILKKEGHDVTLIICPEGQFTSSTEERDYKISRINGKGFDLAAELHLNSYDSSAHGSEVLYYPGAASVAYAQRIVNKLATKFTNRGVKERGDLYMLRETDCQAVLVESFFCDNKSDCDIADKMSMDALAKLIAEGILNKDIVDVNPSDINVGDRVKFVGTHWATGQQVSSWVIGSIFTVSKVETDRVLLDNANSWAWKKDVVKEGSAPKIEVGSRVKITGSNYATGQPIPDWVKASPYTVEQIKEEKALLKEIASWVYLKDLVLV